MKFKWFVKEEYLPICRGRWRTATREKTEHEIKKYLVDKFKDVPLRNIGLFELQTSLNDLAEKYSESIVKHSFVNLRSIMRMAQRLKFISDNPGEETRMPATRPIERPTMTPEQINLLIEAIEDPHDLCLMCIGLFCATRTSETFGLQWKSYGGDNLMIQAPPMKESCIVDKSKQERAEMPCRFPTTLFRSLRLGGRYARTHRPMRSCSRRMVMASLPEAQSPEEPRAF